MHTTINAAGRSLIDADLFRRLTIRLASDHDFDIELAERVIDQTLVLLRACANDPAARLAPSEAVDMGWHTFLLFSREYAAFCEDTAGGFIHHAPAEEHRDLTPRERSDRLAALESTGLAVDRQLWNGAVGRCGQTCHRCNTDPPAAE